MKKKILAILIMVLLLTTGCKKNITIGGDLVTFKDKDLTITANDLYDKLKAKYGTSILIDMMDTKIFDKEYPDSDEINSYVDNQVESIRNYYSTETEFLEYINQYGYENVNDLKEYFKLNYKRNLAVKDYIKTLISDDDIKKYYDEKITGDVTGSHILIEVENNSNATEEEKRTAKEEALAKAKEAIEKIQNGTDFKEVAKEYSTDDATKDQGGSMGTFNTLELDDVTRQEFTKLEVGKYSEEAVETEYGYEIFLKEAVSEKPSLESVKTKIIEKMTNEKLTADSKLQYKGLTYIREKYGFEIKDEDLKVYYENTMKNLLKSE
ncbi:MAG: peptidylprolyl isomerase [Bacilli bacterium]|nr:peptidylprolyl isomerase [Bacilli bacterium]